jgi:periplasmic protein TonB
VSLWAPQQEMRRDDAPTHKLRGATRRFALAGLLLDGSVGTRFLVTIFGAPEGKPSALPLLVALSAAGHGMLIAGVVLASILWPAALPPLHLDTIRVHLSGPPPPPPPPLARGSSLATRTTAARAATPRPDIAAFAAPIGTPAPLPTAAPVSDDAEVAGSDTGSDEGVPEGMEDGVPGGVVGGVPGGVLGGVIGGTGSGPVPATSYDQPPRVIRQVKPDYPHDAFVARLQGTVLVELLVDSSGRVARARVIESIPALDAAAIAAVRQWGFLPATHRGHAVAAVVEAAVSFRIY